MTGRSTSNRVWWPFRREWVPPIHCYPVWNTKTGATRMVELEAGHILELEKDEDFSIMGRYEVRRGRHVWRRNA